MTTDKTPATLAVVVLARKVFEEYSRASGNPPDAHFDRNAAEQWMAHALEFAGVAALVDALTEAHYGGLMVGADCAWALAKLQREGIYKPQCSDGKPSRADAGRDESFIKEVRQKTGAALARVKGESA